MVRVQVISISASSICMPLVDGRRSASTLSQGLGWDGDVPRVARGSDQILQKGDVLSCEPGCYVPGRGGARVENMIWKSDTGPVKLTKTPLHPELAS